MYIYNIYIHIHIYVYMYSCQSQVEYLKYLFDRAIISQASKQSLK